MVKRADCISAMVIVILTALPASAALVDSVNAGLEGEPVAYGIFPGISEMGWLYTPGSSYTLTSIQTKFGTENSPTPPIAPQIKFEIYDDLPSLGGSLLRTIPFSPWFWHGVFLEFPIAPLDLAAGEDYFIGFRDVFYVDKNSALTGTVLPCYGTFVRGGTITPPGTYSDQISQTSCVHPILKFYGTPIPEPAAFLLFGLGALALRKRR